MRNDTKRLSWKAGLVAGGLLALSPALAVAQQAPAPYAMATLYEVREDINCNPGGTPDPLADPFVRAFCLEETLHGFGTRLADATLEGGLHGLPGGVSGPTSGEFTGPITVQADSILSQVDWNGPAHGKLEVQTANGPVIANMQGTLDLSMAKFGLATIGGKWRGMKGTLQAGGEFKGLFLLPFACPAGTPLYGQACYLELKDGQPTGGITALAPAEYLGGTVPLVKLVVWFYNK
jgi:hypothetical protein